MADRGDAPGATNGAHALTHAWAKSQAWFAYVVSPRRIIPFVVAAVFGVLLWQEWNRDPIEDVARAWNKSISRLGMRPLFPPQTDFHVGDVYAVLRLAPGIAEDRLTPLQRSLIDKSFRLGHVDLSEHIRKSYASRPTYGPTGNERAAHTAATAQAAMTGQTSSFDQGFDAGFHVKLGGAGIPATGLMFPAISISTERSWSIAGLITRLTPSGRRKADERIEISNPATYGVDPAPAYFSLVQFCGDKVGCQVDYNLAVMSRLYGPAVCGELNNAKIFDIDMFIVSRVFVSRSIAVARGEDVSLELGQNSPPARPQEGGALAVATGSGPANADVSPIRVSNSFRIASRSSPYTLAFGFQGLAIRAPRAPEGGSAFRC